MSASSEQDRRRHIRIPLNHTILAKTPNNTTFFGITSDICPCGIGFFSDNPLPQGASVEVALELEDPEHHYHDFHLKGHVVHCIDTMENGFHIGVYLDQPSAEYQQVLDKMTAAMAQTSAGKKNKQLTVGRN